MFLVPILFMVIAEGVVWLSSRFGRLSSAAEALLIVGLFLKPLSANAKDLIHPNRGEDIKLAIRYIQAHQQPSDVWFIYHWARYPLVLRRPLQALSCDRAHRQGLRHRCGLLDI